MKWNKSEPGAYQTQRMAMNGINAAQQAAVTTAGFALDVTAFAGGKVSIYLTGPARMRWQSTSTPLTQSATDGAAGSRSVATGAAGVANSGTVRPAGAWDFDVPQPEGAEATIYLIVAAMTATVDVVVTQS